MNVLIFSPTPQEHDDCFIFKLEQNTELKDELLTKLDLEHTISDFSGFMNTSEEVSSMLNYLKYLRTFNSVEKIK